MTASSSDFNETPSLSSSTQHNQAAAVVSASYTCPICNQALIQIQGNCVTYLKNHVFINPDEPQTLVLSHPPQIGTDFVPAKQIKPPFLIIDSMNIVTPRSVPQHDK